MNLCLVCLFTRYLNKIGQFCLGKVMVDYIGTQELCSDSYSASLCEFFMMAANFCFSCLIKTRLSLFSFSESSYFFMFWSADSVAWKQMKCFTQTWKCFYKMFNNFLSNLKFRKEQLVLWSKIQKLDDLYIVCVMNGKEN